MNDNNRLKVVKDRDGQYLIFCLTDDGKLLLKVSSNATVDLSSSLADETVTAFTVFAGDTPANKVRVALATTKSNHSQAYLTDLLELKGLDWNQFKNDSSSWKKVYLEGSGTSGIINQMALSNLHLALATFSKGKDAVYYCSKLGDDKATWQAYSLPENAPSISQMLLGTLYKNQGVFLLYWVGNEQTLLFQSMLDPRYGKTSKFRFACDSETIKSIATLQMDDGNSSLYAMSDKKVLLFNTPDDKKIVITAHDDYFLESFAPIKAIENLNSVSVIERRDKEHSDDKSEKLIIGYTIDLFPNFYVNLFVK